MADERERNVTRALDDAPLYPVTSVRDFAHRHGARLIKPREEAEAGTAPGAGISVEVLQLLIAQGVEITPEVLASLAGTAKAPAAVEQTKEQEPMAEEPKAKHISELDIPGLLNMIEDDAAAIQVSLSQIKRGIEVVRGMSVHGLAAEKAASIRVTVDELRTRDLEPRTQWPPTELDKSIGKKKK